MRCLRALIPIADRCSHVAGGDARPMSAPTVAGRVDRRRLLGLLGAAPIALPAMARVALTPEPLSSTVFFDMDGAYMASLSRYHDELDAWADRVQVWRDGPIPAPPQFQQTPGLVISRGDSQRSLPEARPRPFLDDVGSGP